MKHQEEFELRLTREPNHVEASIMLCALRVFQTIIRLGNNGAVEYTAAELHDAEYFEDFSDAERAMLNSRFIERLCLSIKLQRKDASRLPPKLNAQVKRALKGDSNDAEHDALVAVAEHFGVFVGGYEHKVEENS